MTTEEDERLRSGTTRETKKRRLHGACDLCKQKKVKCDSTRMPNNRCTNCIKSELDCTHLEAIKTWGPAKGYVENLETRVRLLERVLQKLVPNIDLDRLSDSESPIPRKYVWIPPSRISIDVPSDPAPAPPEPESTPNIVTSTAEKDPKIKIVSHGDDSLLDRLSKLTLDPPQHQFCGESSRVSFVKTAYKVKSELGRIKGHARPPRLGSHRPEFWTNPLWEDLEEPKPLPQYDFPSTDLLPVLIDLYFTHFNIYTPLLHRPTFLHAVHTGLHLRHHMFGATLLLVCALGSRFCDDDPRVTLEWTDSTYSRGWKWFAQVQVIRTDVHADPSLYELQMYSLWIMFSMLSSKCQGCWTVAGIGLRMAQEVGAHRRNLNTKIWTVEDELWKRAFWVLFFIDRGLSTVLGRPCAISDEDIDLDLPLECDDEYWESSDPKVAFKQPPNQPSTVAYFNFALKLRQILGRALRNIYSVKRERTGTGSDQNTMIAELDSALNGWVESLPDHLRWDPNHPNPTFFNQSAALYANYYHVQILVHKPFISISSPSSFPSLAICSNAARLCSHVVEVQRCRMEYPLGQMQNPAFISAILLLLNIWSGKQSGLSIVDHSRDLEGVQKCMRYLKACEARRPSAGRYWDILSGLASAGDFSSELFFPSTNKRTREEEDSDPFTSSSSTDDMPSRRVAPTSRSTQNPQQDTFTFALPTLNSQLNLRQIPVPLYEQSESQSNEGEGENEGIDGGQWQSAFNPGWEWFVDFIPQASASEDSVNPSVHIHTTETEGPATEAPSPDLDQFLNDELAVHFSSGTMFQGSGGSGSINLGDSGVPVPGNFWHTQADSLPSTNNDVMSVWNDTPIGKDMEGWETYITNVDSLTGNGNGRGD